jgi:hypothetical protein
MAGGGTILFSLSYLKLIAKIKGRSTFTILCKKTIGHNVLKIQVMYDEVIWFIYNKCILLICQNVYTIHISTHVMLPSSQYLNTCKEFSTNK